MPILFYSTATLGAQENICTSIRPRYMERPERAEGDWLEVNIDASDVNLSELLFRTSNPPKQLLQFTLDDTRYLMHLVRRDVTVEAVPAM